MRRSDSLMLVVFGLLCVSRPLSMHKVVYSALALGVFISL